MLGTAFEWAYCVISVLLLIHASLTPYWMLHAWWESAGRDRRSSRLADIVDLTEPRLSFSLLVPARHEELVLEATLERLAASTHPFVEILVIVGHDDHETSQVAQTVAHRRPDRVRVLTDSHEHKNKPRALNVGLTHASGDIVGVFDAEDDVSPDLLVEVDRRFRSTGADIVQAGVQLVDFHRTWYSVRNCLEYFFWFRSRLAMQADRGFIPLGGNSVFFRRAVLDSLNGWDPDCLTEDCELGVRASVDRFVVKVMYDADLVTKEETPTTLRSWIKQRTRWNQGFLQVLERGEWKRVPARNRTFAWYTLASPLIQAVTGLLIPIAAATVLLGDFPLWMTMVGFLPVIPTVTTLAVEDVGLDDLARSLGDEATWRDRLRLSVGAIPYQVLLGLAAARAVWRHHRGTANWEKTEHIGSHRQQEKEFARVG